MYKIIRVVLIVFFACVFVFSGYKLWSIYAEYNESEKFYDSMANDYIAERESGTSAGNEGDAQADLNVAPITIDFAALTAASSDVVGWLYCEGTAINYPIVQSEDNAYYLHRLFDGTYNSGGSLFLDYRNSFDFTDSNSVVYGHNMKDGSMFGTLVNYKDAEYFTEHPVMYLLTPDKDYKIEIFAGCVTDYKSEAYTKNFETEAEAEEFIQAAYATSTFTSGVEVTAADKIITLSTCSYEFDNARYVIFGKLTELER